jgi:hypothetical protein
LGLSLGVETGAARLPFLIPANANVTVIARVEPGNDSL